MMFLSPVFNPDFLPLAHPLYNECLFYHVSTLFLNSNPLRWWHPFSVLAPSSLFLLPVFNPDNRVWCFACNALWVSENLLSCRQLTTVSSGIEISWSYCIQLTDHGLVCDPPWGYKNLIYGMAQVTLGFSRATHTPTPAYPHPHSRVRVLPGTGCGFSVYPYPYHGYRLRRQRKIFTRLGDTWLVLLVVVL